MKRGEQFGSVESMPPGVAEDLERSASVLDDPWVGLALAEYWAEFESGRHPDREALLVRFPEARQALEGCLASLEAVARWTAPSSRDGMSAGATDTRECDVTAVPLQEQIGDYRLLRPIGRGGMGVVYEAEQISLGRRVAVKILPFATVLDERKRIRFLNEARAVAMLDHPGIVTVHAVGCDLGIHYYAMQLIEGRTLAQVIDELQRLCTHGPLPSSSLAVVCPSTIDDTNHADGDGSSLDSDLRGRLSPASSPHYFRTMAEWGIQAAEALQHAHSTGIVHRDIKPSNLILTNEGQLFVVDFGLALVRNEARLTMTGDLLGTARYMSPEQVRGPADELDHRTDIYSLGVTFYEICTLQPVFGSEDRHRVLQRVLYEDPVPPRQINRAVPADLETILLKALAKRPNERYATAAALAEDLRRFVDGRPILARPPSAVARAAKWLGRRRALVTSVTAAIGGVVLVIAALLTLAWWVEPRAEQRSQARTSFLATLERASHPHDLWRTAKYDDAVAVQQQLAGTLRSLEAGIGHRADYWQEALEAHLTLARWLNAIHQRQQASTVLDTAARALAALEQHTGPSHAWRYALATRLAEHARRLMTVGEYPQAAESLRRALDLCESLGDLEPAVLLQIAQCHYDLAECYRHLGLDPRAKSGLQAYELAFADYLGQPPSDTVPPPALDVPLGRMHFVDLSGHANAVRIDADQPSNDLNDLNDLRELPEGDQWFMGVKFRVVQRYLHLGCYHALFELPESIEGISVGVPCSHLFFLHSTLFRASDNAQIAEYRVHFDDGTTDTISVVYGVDLRDFWHRQKQDSCPTTLARIAWRGRNPALASFQDVDLPSPRLRLFLSVWENPHPEKKIVSLDYLANFDFPTAPFCVAISCQLSEPAVDFHRRTLR